VEFLLTFKYAIVGIILASFSCFVSQGVQYGDKRIYGLLLGLIAVGIMGLIWQFVGFEKMSAILISFIVAGVFGLLKVGKKEQG